MDSWPAGWGGLVHWGQTDTSGDSARLAINPGNFVSFTTPWSDRNYGINLNTWYYIVGTYDSSSNALMLYVNGANVVNSTWPSLSLENTPIRIGSSYDVWFQNFFPFKMDDLAIYSRVLSPSEISANYFGQLGITLSSIAITTPANKLTYTVGDSLDITGLAVTGTYSDSSTAAVPITTSNISGFDSQQPQVVKL